MDSAPIGQNFISECAKFLFSLPLRTLNSGLIGFEVPSARTATPTAQTTTALVFQFEAIHDGTRVREFIIRASASTEVASALSTLPTCAARRLQKAYAVSGIRARMQRQIEWTDPGLPTSATRHKLDGHSHRGSPLHPR